jgi:hypothetical protein
MARMTDSSPMMYEINRTLGTVLEKLENIEKTLDHEASVRVELARTVSALELRTVFVERDVNSAKPFIDKAKQWEQRGIGMIAAVSAVGAIFGGVVIGLREKLMHAIGLA